MLAMLKLWTNPVYVFFMMSWCVCVCCCHGNMFDRFYFRHTETMDETCFLVCFVVMVMYVMHVLLSW